MTANFQETLKALGKQAKKEAAEREAEVKAKKQAEDVDFSKAVGKVTPLKMPATIMNSPAINRLSNRDLKKWRLWSRKIIFMWAAAAGKNRRHRSVKTDRGKMI